MYSKPTAGAARLKVDGATTRTFSTAGTLAFTGSSTAAEVHYALITPGAVIEQGDLPVRGGKFQYVFDPAAVHAKVPLYDVVSVTTGKPQIGRVIDLTFFSEETGPGGVVFADVSRVVLRGTTAISARATVRPAAMTMDTFVDGTLAAARVTAPVVPTGWPFVLANTRADLSVPPDNVKPRFTPAVLETVSVPPEITNAASQRKLRMTLLPLPCVTVISAGVSITTSSAGLGSAPPSQLATSFQLPLVPTQ